MKQVIKRSSSSMYAEGKRTDDILIALTRKDETRFSLRVIAKHSNAEKNEGSSDRI